MGISTRFRIITGIVFLLLLGLPVAQADRSFLADYLQVHYDFGSGLLSDEANQVMQTRDGYIWVASYAGLLRYDSQRFQLMKDVDGQSIMRVRSLFEDSKSRLWIGTNNMGLLRYEAGKITPVKEETAPIVRAVTEDESGTVYIASSEGVRLFPAGRDSTMVADTRLERCLIQSLSYSQKEQKVWGVTFRGDVFSLQGQVVTDFYPAAAFPGTTPTSVFCDSHGRVFVGTLGHTVLMREQLFFQPLLTTQRSNITSIYEDTQGRIWLCAEDGVGYLDSDLKYVSVDGSLLSAAIENIYEDYERNYWIASSRQGILHLIRNKFRNLAFENSLPMDVYNAFAFYQGRGYFGDNAGLYITERGKKVENDFTTFLKGIRIRDLLPDKEGNLWVAAYGKPGLICYRDGSWENWTKANGLPSDKIRKLLERSNGDIVVGTGDGVSILRSGQLVKNYGRAEGVNNGVILSLEEMADGSLLAGSDGDGIYRIRPDEQVEHINALPDGQKLGPVLNLCRDDARGGIWVSNGNQIAFMDETGIHSIDSQGQNFNNIFDLKIIGNKIWLLGARGLMVTEAADLLAGTQTEVQQIDFSTAMQTMLTANARNPLMPDGTLYLSCSRGVFSVDTSHIYKNDVPPRIGVSEISIDSIQVDGKAIQPGQTVSLPSDAQRLTIRFEVLSFVNNDGELEYYMDGVDSKPTKVEGKNVHEASYTNLKGGDYTFHIRAKNGDGQSAEADKVFKLHKDYRLTELPLVQAMLVLLAAGILTLLLRINMRRKVKAAQAQQRVYQNITLEAIRAISRTIDAKDTYTNGHSYRVAEYTRSIAKAMGWKEKQLEEIYYIALLHDIGKIGVPDHILKKPGKLTEEEYAKIKQHTEIGSQILKDITLLPQISEGARHHHERYDGKGYPDGLKGDQIPLEARIICVADSFDAMYSVRVYRRAINLDEIQAELRRCSGSQFDPQIVQVLLELIDKGIIPGVK